MNTTDDSEYVGRHRVTEATAPNMRAVEIVHRHGVLVRSEKAAIRRARLRRIWRMPATALDALVGVR